MTHLSLLNKNAPLYSEGTLLIFSRIDVRYNVTIFSKELEVLYINTVSSHVDNT